MIFVPRAFWKFSLATLLLLTSLNAEAFRPFIPFALRSPQLIFFSQAGGSTGGPLNTSLNTFDTAILTYKNKGTASSSVISVTLPAGFFTVDYDNCNGVKLGAGATCDISLTYSLGFDLSDTLTISAVAGGSVARTIQGCGATSCY